MLNIMLRIGLLWIGILFGCASSSSAGRITFDGSKPTDGATDATQDAGVTAGEDAAVNDAGLAEMDAMLDAKPDAMLPERCSTYFSDVPSDHPAYEAAHALYVAEVTDGCATAPLRYCPADSLRRDGAAVMLMKARGESPSNAAYNAYFSDILDNSAAGYINKMKELGITNGCEVGKYCPTVAATRAEFAALLVGTLGESTSNAATNAYFDDVGAFAAGYANRLYELGITQGCATRKFCPSDPTSRAQAALFIARAFNLSLAVCGL